MTTFTALMAAPIHTFLLKLLVGDPDWQSWFAAPHIYFVGEN